MRRPEQVSLSVSQLLPVSVVATLELVGLIFYGSNANEIARTAMLPIIAFLGSAIVASTTLVVLIAAMSQYFTYEEIKQKVNFLAKAAFICFFIGTLGTVFTILASFSIMDKCDTIIRSFSLGLFISTCIACLLHIVAYETKKK